MNWFNKKKAKPIAEPGLQTMDACISCFEGTEVMDPSAFCQYQRVNGIGYFAKGYSGGLESMKEKDRAMYAEQMRDTVSKWNGMRPSERAMWRPENDAILKTSVPSSAMGALMRPTTTESDKGGDAIDCLVNLCEAEVDREKREIRCHVISEGKGKSTKG